MGPRFDVVLAARGCCLILGVSCWFDERPPEYSGCTEGKCAVWGGDIGFTAEDLWLNMVSSSSLASRDYT